MEQVSLGMATGQLVLLARSEHRAGVLAGWDTPFPGYSWAVERHQMWPAGREVCGTVHECHNDWLQSQPHGATTFRKHMLQWTEAILRRGGCENVKWEGWSRTCAQRFWNSWGDLEAMAAKMKQLLGGTARM